MKNINFADFITPITRIAAAATSLLHDIISNLIPSIGFLIVITAYFCLKNWKLGAGFLLGNCFIFVYLFFCWKSMFEYKKKQEKIVVENERYILDNLNNLDKVIYRGTVKEEMGIFEEKTQECIDFSIEMMQYMTNHMFVMNSMIYVIILSSIYYILSLHANKHMDTLTVITFLTILIMYRDNISDTVQSIPHNMDLAGRIEIVLREFNEMINGENVIDVMNRQNQYKKTVLQFDTVKFENVSFRYPYTDRLIFDNYTSEIDLNQKILGVTGLSGNGKSSFVKLLMRLYDCNKGKIYIDGQDIKMIDPSYIRSNITYVNQNSRLFDRKVLENILYGCKNKSACNENLKEVLSFEKVQELYRNVNLDSHAGPLGENLSGGQRQVANLISGFINPSKILILDEPTNALDPALKREVIAIIQHFRKYKKCIIIITHDRDLYSLFDETLEI
jgi:ABC-type multidrug transport system fused ATPase/permease subunit